MGYITLNKNHFFHNMDLIAAQVNDKTKIAIVLKDNAYGHGLTEMAQLACDYGVLHAVVRSSFEATKIAGFFDSILILADSGEELLPDNASLAVNDFSLLETLKPASAIELKIDTGMHRNGLSIEELEAAFEMIQKKELRLKGVFTHHRSADLLSSEYFWQEKAFERIKEKSQELIARYDMPPIRYHSQNSAATFRTKSHGDIVRIGIAAYGLLQMPKPLLDLEFKPVLSLWAQKIHSYKSHAHKLHGYEGKGRIKEDKIVSSYDVGYADGLLRLQDDISHRTPDGSFIVGRVSMDNIIADSSQPLLCIYDDARVYAVSASTISYEVTTRLASHLKRSII